MVSPFALALTASACGAAGPVEAVRTTASRPAGVTVAPAETSPQTTEAIPPALTTAEPTTTRPRSITSTTGRTSAPAPPATTTPPAPPPGGPRRAVGWDRYAVSGGGRTLTLTYYSGPPPCSINDGIQVEETGSEVRVTIYERDGSGGQPCIAIAQEKSATVTLASALGSRRVVDGAG